ncbi:PAS domain S-box protein [Thermoleptolyngbya sichuanensis XZ-Cy5]|uniref:PAS domain S-box protein n=1 Tax=Thermoleptolyngbya sichuanensis TaxID=2885951 RepID=UPI00240E19E7|nr:PAS domain S-box protein [Thermoleptolyngbya sichuanensis]MDG2617968.1 PAS domain S-box protein [Thermoleptolyngbya sichuanensis XZ-Cy5]
MDESQAPKSQLPLVSSAAQAGDLDWVPEGEAALRSRIAELEAQLQQQQAALQQAQAAQQIGEQLQGLLDGVDAAIAQIRHFADGRWYYTYCSAGYAYIFGYSAQEFIAQPGLWHEQVHPDDRAIAQTIFANILAVHADTPSSQRTFAVEYRFTHKTTGLRWISTRFRVEKPTKSADGQTSWIVNTLNIDITDRKQAELALQEQESLLRLTLNLNHVGTWKWDLATGRLDWNENHFRLLGLSPTDVEPTYEHWQQAVHPDDLSWVEENVQAALIQQTDYRAEYRIILPDGTTRWLLGLGRGLHASSGTPTGMIGIIMDITSRTQTEAALRLSEARLAGILDIAADAIILVDQSQRIILFNQSAERIFGYSSAEVMGQSIDVLLPQDLFETDREAIHESTLLRSPHQRSPHQSEQPPQRGNRLLGEVRARRKDGSEFPAEASVSRLVQGGEVVFTAILRDISDRKRIEADRLQAQASLHQQFARERALNRVMQAIRNSLDLQDVFATATREVAFLLAVNGVWVSRYDSQRGVWVDVASYAHSANFRPPGLEIPDDNNPIAARLKCLEIVQIDCSEDLTLVDPAYPAKGEATAAVWLLVPLRVEGIVWGALGLSSNRHIKAWREDEVALVRLVADQMAIAIQQSHLYQTAQAELAERRRVEADLQRLNQDLEQRVRERTAQLQISLSTAQMGIWERDMATGAQTWSPENYAILGYCTDADGRVLDSHGNEISPRPVHQLFYDRVHPDDRERLDKIEYDCLQTHMPYDLEYRVVWLDGSTHWLYERGTYLFDDAGVAVKLIGVTMDVTHLKQTEAALRQSEEMFRQLFENAPIGILLLSPETGHILRANQRFCQMLGYTPEEMTRFTPADITYPADWNLSAPLLEQAMRETSRLGSPQEVPHFRIEKRLIHKDGQILWVELTACFVRNDLSRLGYGVAMVQEIGDRKQADAQIRTSLQEKEVLLKEIHHRVKNNLQVISSLLRMQARRLDDRTTATLLLESQNRVQSMAIIHEQLYQSANFSKIDLDNYIRPLVANLFQTYGVSQQHIVPAIATHGLSFNLNTAIPCGLIINELVSNALKYAFPEGQSGNITICVEIQPPADDSTTSHLGTLTVSDNGVGMPPDLDWQHTNSLGLVIVRSLVAQLQGDLELQRESGTMFIIRFPIANPSA